MNAPCSPALLSHSGRLVSGLTLTCPHCVSCTVIHGRVLGGHGAQLQGELVPGRVSGYGGSDLEGGAVVSTPSTTYACNPLHPFSQRLADPVPAVTTGCDGESRDRAGEGEGLRGLHQSWALLLQLHLGQDTWAERTQ